MSVKTKIVSSQGKGWGCGVTRDHALRVEVMPTRRANIPSELLTASKLYREWFTTAAGAADMNVLGSLSTPVKYVVDSKSDRCLMVNQMRLLLDSGTMQVTGGSAEVRRFGAAAVAPGLANGLTLNVIQEGVVTPVFLDPVKNVGDFFAYTDTYLNFVDGSANNVDIFTVTIDFDVPIFLPAGSVDRIELQVRDNLTAIAYFRALVLGSQELRLEE